RQRAGEMARDPGRQGGAVLGEAVVAEIDLGMAEGHRRRTAEKQRQHRIAPRHLPHRPRDARAKGLVFGHHGARYNAAPRRKSMTAKGTARSTISPSRARVLFERARRPT